jgi:large subunit ribosomal protein L5
MAKEAKKTVKSDGGGDAYVSRVRARYEDEVVPSLQKEFAIENIMAVPRIEKVVLNIGLGEATQNVKLLDDAAEELSTLAGQKAVITRARKSIANFKLREGMPIGCRVTLRGQRMWDFLDRLIAIALPRVRDFRGIPTKSFDGRGNFTMGIPDHLIFPDLEYDKIDKTKGLNVTIVTSARRDEEALSLLRGLGMPFRKAS